LLVAIFFLKKKKGKEKGRDKERERNIRIVLDAWLEDGS
jgi:hypothetical protein